MQILISIVVMLLLSTCSAQTHVKLTNNSCKPVSEIETLNLTAFDFKNLSMDGQLLMQNENGETVLSQLIDENLDGIADQVVFPVSVPGNSSVRYRFSVSEKPVSDTIPDRTYCRFVPERMDDFAWENDKVAFRTYGQACQKLFEQGDPAGLISSGIDCWLKRVKYPIIDKWYKKAENGGSYHTDDGEGLDNFQVGLSRGCGGTAIRNKGGFIYSENYSEWQVLANGPLRTIFKLKYKPVMVEGKPVIETKTFTIDRGDNFYRCDVEFESELSIDTLAVGLTLHDNLGKTDCSTEGWISYWEHMGDSEIGMGAWVNKGCMSGCKKIENAGKDMNHIWLFASLKENRCTYFSGFEWKKSGQFNSEKTWERYIKMQTDNLQCNISKSVY